jgi:hypothetical protein
VCVFWCVCVCVCVHALLVIVSDQFPQVQQLKSPEDQPRGEKVVASLAQWLGNAGPQYSPRARRSAVEVASDHRLPVLYALGNSRHPHAVPHLLRHANGSTEEDLETIRAHRVRHGEHAGCLLGMRAVVVSS